jgi:hypothetical protein
MHCKMRLWNVTFRREIGAVIVATRELRFSIRAGVVPMFDMTPFPADHLDVDLTAHQKDFNEV